MGDEAPPRESITWAPWYRSSFKENRQRLPHIEVRMVNLMELSAGDTG